MSKRRNLADLSRSFGSGNHPLAKCSHEEWRNWANLPSVLIDDIARRLLRYDVSEYLRLRAACKEWRDSTADPRGGSDLDSRFRPRRWIILSNNTDGVRRRFLNLATGACGHVDLPELSGHHLETSTEGFLVLRDKASDAIRLLNPLTKALTDLPSITEELRIMCRTVKEQRHPSWTSILYADISDETSPATVVLFLRGTVWNLAYAKPGDERWSLMEDEGWKALPSRRIIKDGEALKHVWYLSALTLRGRVYFPTFEGNILKVRIHPKPRLVPVVKNQALDRVWHNTFSYLVPADDNHSRMLMVRMYNNLKHLSQAEQRRLKRKKNRDVIKLVFYKPRQYRWYLIQVFEVDLAGKRLVQVGDIGRRAVLVGNEACVSLSTKTFPSMAGNAVYLGVDTTASSCFGVFYLTDKSIGPPFEFALEDGSKAFNCGLRLAPGENAVPLARPCSLQEYLVCYAGISGGIKD